MNAKTIAATLVIVAGMTVGAATAHANPGNDGGCGNGKASQGCEPDRGNECSNGNHVGNPHCVTVTVTPSPTGTPSTTPTVTPTVTATPFAAPVEDGDNDPCKNHPFLNQHNQLRVFRAGVWMQDTDCGQYLPEPKAEVAGTVDLVPPAVSPAPFGPVLFGNYPQPDFDVTTITALPKAGDGSLAD